MKDELIASLLGTAMGTANNVVNKVAEDHKRTLEKEEAIAREQEQTKRAIAQEEERTRREFVEKGLDQKHRNEIKELQRKRQENPINTVCQSCTGRMEVDRFKGMLTCPYCGHTQVLDPIHCYDPILDEPELTNLKPKSAPIAEPKPTVQKSNDTPQTSTTQNGVIIEKLNVRPNKSFSTSSSTSIPHINPGVVRPATSVDKDPEPFVNKVASAAKLIDTKPVETFVKHETRGLVLSIISLVCGIVGLITCGALIVPEVAGILTSIIPLIGSTNKYGKLSKTLAGIGMLTSLSACGLILISIFILKK